MVAVTKAYLFVSGKAGKTKDVAKALARLSGVKAADICWGLPDIIAVVSVMFVSIGCNSLGLLGPMSPFLAASFNTTLAGVLSSGSLNPGGGTVPAAVGRRSPPSLSSLNRSGRSRSPSRMRLRRECGSR